MIDLDRYNVTWNSPSRDISGTMPLGNGDIGLNVWVEESTGDLLLLIGKSDAWDENSINMKLGRIRITFVPDPLSAGKIFRQTLNLRTADIDIAMGKVAIRLWIDSNRPVIHIEADGLTPFAMTATLEMWRTHEYVMKTQTGDMFRSLDDKDPFPTIISPDRLLPGRPNRIMWCHHNERRENDPFEINMKLQGLGGFIDRMPHPLLGRTFGGAMEGPEFVAINETSLRSTARTSHRLFIVALTSHPSTIGEWSSQLDGAIDSIRLVDRARTHHEHKKWWSDFWNRSWIDVPGEFHVSQAYALQRFMNACAGRGASPIKFNGSIFSVGKPENPDWRRWGGPGFWFMNLRLIYWPMLTSGDFDLMRPWLAMYRNQVPLQRHRTRTYFNHGGAHYPETITFWGAEVSAHYGWTPFEQRKSPVAECSYVTYYWTCGIEISLILCNYYLHTKDEGFAREYLIPIADAVTEFFDVHYPRDLDGTIRFEPAQALETYQDCTNPLPEIAGLRYLLPILLALPERLTGASIQQRWARMLGHVPPIPIGARDGVRVILPAHRADKKRNTENPELYCVFPFRLFGVGKPDLQLARDTFAARLHRSHDCWSQDDVQMALLGLTDQAKEYVTKRTSPAAHSDSRFPGFWNAFHDWIPDMDHGGVLQLALQSMLMQTEGDQILLLPAWPNEWEADFRLHAPRQTIVEGKVRAGRMVELRVTPESRRGDVIYASILST